MTIVDSIVLSDLPALSDRRTVSTDDAAFFREKGHVLIRDLASPSEVAAYRPAIAAAADRYNVELRPIAQRDTYGKAFLQIMNLWCGDESVRRFVTAKRFAGVAAQLLGVHAVRLYHDQALFKEPGGGPTPWHQDQFYWPLDTSNTVTMWMPLVDIPPEVGSMTFATGSHKQGYIEAVAISDESHSFFDGYVKEAGMPLHSYGALSAGDATFHYGWTLHCAPPNPTPKMREVMTVISFADGTRVLEPNNSYRVDDLDHWLCNTRPGELAQSELNPLLYSE
jgi:ectoine hydroxylase-related dioxygenase (phytanoyl-CoA dioxygenase family)